MNAFKSRNLTNDRDGNPHVLNEAENQSFLGFKFGALINSEKSVDFQQLRKTLSTMDCSSGFRGNGGRRADVGHVTSTIARRDVWSATRRSKFADRRWARKLSARSHFGLATAVPSFQVRMIRKWSILNRFYLQTGAHSTRPRRQLNAPGPSV